MAPVRDPFLNWSGESAGAPSLRAYEHPLRTSTASVEQAIPTLPVEPVVTSQPPVNVTGVSARRRADDSLLSTSKTGYDFRAPVDPQSMGSERVTSGDVSPTRDNTPPPVTVTPTPRFPSATQCPHRAALRASTIPSDGPVPSNFNHTRDYSTGNVVLFWQPPSIFSQWTALEFVVDDVSYSCAEHFMMAEKARLFHDHRALELILSTSEPQSRKRVGRSVRSFDNAIWERERGYAVLAGAFAKFSQNPEMKHHLLGTGSNKLLPEPSLFDQVRGIGLRANDPDAHDPHLWRGNNFLGQALSTVRDLLRHNTDELAHPSSSPQFCTPTNPATPTRLRVSARACPGPPSEFSTHFSDAPADHSPDVLAVASCAASTLADTPSLLKHGPGLVGGTIALDNAFFTSQITVHSGTTASTVFVCVALLDTGSPQTLICRDVLEHMLLAAAVNCQQDSAPRFLGEIRQIRSPTNFDERSLERPILPD